jgi:hypothetical protein
MRRLALSCCIVCLAACGGGDETVVERPDAIAFDAVALIDSSIVPAVAGEDGWNYVLASEADLTGDGIAERAVLTARVELYRGRPAWDDGQPWQVYVEFPDGTRRHLYAQRLQLGTLTLRLAEARAPAPATLVLLEQLPDRLRVIEVSFDDRQEPTTRLLVERMLDPTGQAASPHLP